MKVVAYGIKPQEKILLAKVNLKLHDITVISNDLTPETVNYSSGKNALILTNLDSLSLQLIKIIAGYGIKLIIILNADVDKNLNEYAAQSDIELIYLPIVKEETLLKKSTIPPEDSLIRRWSTETIQALNKWQDSHPINLHLSK